MGAVHVGRGPGADLDTQDSGAEVSLLQSHCHQLPNLNIVFQLMCTIKEEFNLST